MFQIDFDPKELVVIVDTKKLSTEYVEHITASLEDGAHPEAKYLIEQGAPKIAEAVGAFFAQDLIAGANPVVVLSALQIYLDGYVSRVHSAVSTAINSKRKDVN